MTDEAETPQTEAENNEVALPLRERGKSITLTNPIHLEAVVTMQKAMADAVAAREQLADMLTTIEMKERKARAAFWRMLDAAGLTDCENYKYQLSHENIDIDPMTFEVTVKDDGPKATVRCIDKAVEEAIAGIAGATGKAPKNVEDLMKFLEEAAAKAAGGNNKKGMN